MFPLWKYRYNMLSCWGIGYWIHAGMTSRVVGFGFSNRENRFIEIKKAEWTDSRMGRKGKGGGMEQKEITTKLFLQLKALQVIQVAIVVDVKLMSYALPSPSPSTAHPHYLNLLSPKEGF